MMTIKAIIWDIGGVIARTEDRTPREKLAADLGVTRDQLNYLFFSGPDGTRAQKGEISVEELIARARADLGLAPDECPDLRERFFAGDRIDSELVDFIRTLRPRYQIGVISNAWGDLVEMLTRWGIADAFDEIVGSGNEGVMKPDARIYQIALERLNICADEAVFVDDFSENIAGARKSGMHAIHFKSPQQVIADLRDLLKI